jgi:hypothetical protein
MAGCVGFSHARSLRCGPSHRTTETHRSRLARTASLARVHFRAGIEPAGSSAHFREGRCGASSRIATTEPSWGLSEALTRPGRP